MRPRMSTTHVSADVTSAVKERLKPRRNPMRMDAERFPIQTPMGVLADRYNKILMVVCPGASSPPRDTST